MFFGGEAGLDGGCGAGLCFGRTGSILCSFWLGCGFSDFFSCWFGVDCLGCESLLDLLLLGMATSRGAENVSRKYQASYSASKASMVKAQQVNAVDHMTLVNRFCQPLLMWLVYERTLAGALPARDMAALAGDLNELAKVDWTPQPLPEIDRSRRASAIETELSTHQTTYADIYGEKSRDWRKQLRQRAQEKAYIAELEREYGVSLAFGQTAPAAPQAFLLSRGQYREYPA